MIARLEAHVMALAEPRHWETAPRGLDRAESYVAAELGSLGLSVGRQFFDYGGRRFGNVVASLADVSADGPRLLVGAHLDTVRGSPGANDNASGLAGLIEAARELADRPPSLPVDFVAFHLEERQRWTYRIGSRRFVRDARRRSVEYGGAYVYDMIGCRRTEPGSQRVPPVLSWMGLPTTGDFIAVLGDSGSRRLIAAFGAAAAAGLAVVDLTVPLRGWPVWHVRRSDNASFWSAGIPAVLITDTGNFRNPHYHRHTDTPATLDYAFMADIVRATVGAVRQTGAGLAPPPRGNP